VGVAAVLPVLVILKDTLRVAGLTMADPVTSALNLRGNPRGYAEHCAYVNTRRVSEY
jgi:hypothetical protein